MAETNTPTAAHSTEQLLEYADLLDRADCHDDMGLSVLQTQTADLLRWAAARCRTLEVQYEAAQGAIQEMMAEMNQIQDVLQGDHDKPVIDAAGEVALALEMSEAVRQEQQARADALEASCRTLEKDADALHVEIEEVEADRDAYKARADALAQEAERLRGLLQEMAAISDGSIDVGDPSFFGSIRDSARALLAEDKSRVMKKLADNVGHNVAALAQRVAELEREIVVLHDEVAHWGEAHFEEQARAEHYKLENAALRAELERYGHHEVQFKALPPEEPR